ncbi:MAG: hypothetical protein OEZ13_06805 [Spirochaetia bacterium]|nr:hypothetical protein [Spirochaetia bacterium]
MNTINPQIQDYILQEKTSPRKIKNLILIKKFIDRMADKLFLPEEEIAKIEKKYGVKPDLQSWGDYFQIEIMRDHHKKTDEEFEKIIQTVIFDVIASILIFTGKQKNFIDHIKERQLEASLKNSQELTADDEESLHMGILLQYFQEMGLSIDNMTREDFTFFEEFSTKQAM